MTAAEADAYRKQIDHWADYFKLSAKNGGLKPNLITDPTDGILHTVAVGEKPVGEMRAEEARGARDEDPHAALPRPMDS